MGPRPILNKPITAIWSAKMTYIARGLFSVFVADMEMQCTPPQALFLPFKKKSEEFNSEARGGTLGYVHILTQVKRITDHSHNKNIWAPSSANSSVLYSMQPFQG
jgi:hypothetical protein